MGYDSARDCWNHNPPSLQPRLATKLKTDPGFRRAWFAQQRRIDDAFAAAEGMIPNPSLSGPTYIPSEKQVTLTLDQKLLLQKYGPETPRNYDSARDCWNHNPPALRHLLKH
ncbi:MAG: hypothetical protein Q7R96_04010 [Nanoarchaeota archaeon]|nr:hypothetical protein [Nanoarchaeota archaeon]